MFYIMLFLNIFIISYFTKKVNHLIKSYPHSADANTDTVVSYRVISSPVHFVWLTTWKNAVFLPRFVHFRCRYKQQ